ncbi:MAG: SCO family protein [Micavibrio sp.]|nr:SCO family protein [Micavibrio sp.]
MKRTSINIRLLLAALFFACAIGIATAQAHSLDEGDNRVAQRAAIASADKGLNFSLLDGDGKPVTEKSWPGKYQLVFFGFTHCPDICPVTLDKLSVALGKLGADAEKVQTLFVTTDPERDTPDVVKTYVSNVNKSIVGLTGSEAQVKAAEDTFKVYAVKRTGADGEVTVDHSAFIYVVSPDGKLLDVIRGEATADDIVSKVKSYL